MIQAINAQKIIEMLEYTAVHDIRQAPETVGFSFEIVQDATGIIIAPALETQRSYELDLDAELCKRTVLEVDVAFLVVRYNHQYLVTLGEMRPSTTSPNPVHLWIQAVES